jgi:hypothetical protein
MCWSGEASAVLATIGLSTTAYAVYKKESPMLWMPLGYFALMELLQAYTYTVINQCDLPANQIATFLGYMHIAFQPFFANAVSLYFVPKEVREKVQYWAYAICFVCMIGTMMQLMPFDWAGTCLPTRPLCGPHFCSVSGNWHIAWEMPINGLGNYFTRLNIVGLRNGFMPYMLAAFFLPLFYGSWRFTLYHLLMGPFLAQLLTNNHNERPAVWCLLSIGLLLIVVKTPIRKYLFVKKWIFWPKAKKAPEERG